MTSEKWPQRAKAMMSKDSNPTFVGEHKIRSGVSRNVRIAPVLPVKQVDVSRATRVSTVFWTTRGESWCRRFHTDSNQFQVKQQLAKIAMYP